MPEISPQAIVANPAGLADDVQVGPFAVLGPDVTVGAGTIISAGATLVGRTRVGRNCRLLPGCIVGCEPTPGDGAPRGGGTCTIGDNNTVREHVTVEAGLAAGQSGTMLGPNNLLMVGCHVGHNAVLEGDGIFANFTRIGHDARIERFVRTSGLTNISPGATVGAYTFTTGYAGVSGDAPPFAIVQGLPCRVRCVNTENLRRCGFDARAIATLKDAFRLLFDEDSAPPGESRLAQVERQFAHDEHVRALVASLRRSAARPQADETQEEA